jgi:hypothetical protein
MDKEVRMRKYSDATYSYIQWHAKGLHMTNFLQEASPENLTLIHKLFLLVILSYIL